MSRIQGTRFICRALLAFGLAACATAGRDPAYWLGRNIDELIEVAGQPIQIYAAKPSHGFAYVWPPVGACAVAFVTDAGGTVIDLVQGSFCEPGG